MRFVQLRLFLDLLSVVVEGIIPPNFRKRKRITCELNIINSIDYTILSTDPRVFKCKI